jgi:hypothetical protein
MTNLQPAHGVYCAACRPNLTHSDRVPLVRFQFTGDVEGRSRRAGRSAISDPRARHRHVQSPGRDGAGPGGRERAHQTIDGRVGSAWLSPIRARPGAGALRSLHRPAVAV